VRGEEWRVEKGFLPRQPDDANYVSERAIEIHIRVIVFADGFATIATALQLFTASRTGLAAMLNLRSGL
jgi:hypothetical protein